jgi:hypothetical protein
MIRKKERQWSWINCRHVQVVFATDLVRLCGMCGVTYETTTKAVQRRGLRYDGETDPQSIAA